MVVVRIERGNVAVNKLLFADRNRKLTQTLRVEQRRLVSDFGRGCTRTKPAIKLVYTSVMRCSIGHKVSDVTV